MTNPQLSTIEPTDGIDFIDLIDNRQAGIDWANDHVPPRFADATTTRPVIHTWVAQLLNTAITRRRCGQPVARRGRSLLIVGPIGTGKTHQAYGALRALSVSGAVCKWQATTELDLFRRLRPSNGHDAPAEYRTIAGAHVLLLDDLGTEKRTEWTESQLLSIIDHRYAYMLPTLITSNIAPGDFGATFGDRVTSRLAEMTDIVTLEGPDRRRTP